MSFKWFLFFSLFVSSYGFSESKDMARVLKISQLDNAPKLKILKKAMKELKALKIHNPKTLTVIDYQLPSSKRRLWVLDLHTQKILHHEYVTHGQNTGMNYAKSFSNTQNSKQSSLGVFKTLETYTGKHGYSLRLQGLQKGINDNAFKRAIVMHGADYVSDAFLKKHGRLGRSWGCPALDPKVSKRVIDTLKGGTYIFSYF